MRTVRGRAACRLRAATGLGLLGLALLSAPGCSGLPAVHELAPLPAAGACRVAVLPFRNETRYPVGAVLVYRVFLAELVQAGRFDVVQEGDVREVLRGHLRLLPGQDPLWEHMPILHDRLGADLVVSGRVMEMDDQGRGGGVNPVLAIRLEIRDGASGRLLWETYHRRDGQHYRKVLHFGLINSMTALARQMAREVLDEWTKRGLRGCTG
ncbi:hypothetical protein G3N55_01490 [Dissulfurirhabdus thermomarina]|uniref:ABC-type transport auxiliary lipoprotein component domain-containing protein n=1 Tax=Dissulfurirhabdus thermomarina TaxID=1765737 RepID=A0A6N9TQ21_DISTH|nr:hypothetical protein [Dissulfurirhabdus thermomarina]NDY41527.1 hypothetical protein [Dissulfurirhabdus thermomarina]NMX22954.1 hypothetical protein [Dissulfurirhabdus thermomarina]